MVTKLISTLLLFVSVASTAHASSWQDSADVASEITASDDGGDRYSEIFDALENHRIIQKIRDIQRDTSCTSDCTDRYDNEGGD